MRVVIRWLLLLLLAMTAAGVIYRVLVELRLV